jgi:hypothetical protein
VTGPRAPAAHTASLHNVQYGTVPIIPALAALGYGGSYYGDAGHDKFKSGGGPGAKACRALGRAGAQQ